jgi:hypothetical protein
MGTGIERGLVQLATCLGLKFILGEPCTELTQCHQFLQLAGRIRLRTYYYNLCSVMRNRHESLNLKFTVPISQSPIRFLADATEC